jgi:hypothetical protein
MLVVPMDQASAPTTISYHADLSVMTHKAPYQVVAPAGLPASWSPVNSGVAVGGANGAGTVTSATSPRPARSRRWKRPTPLPRRSSAG